MVGRNYGHPALTSGTARKAGRARAPAAGPSDTLGRVSGPVQPPARGDHPHAAPARGGRRGDGHHSPRWSWARLLKRVFALDMAHRPSDVSPHTARGWGDLAVRRQRLPSAPCCCPCAAFHAVATSCTLARLSLRPCSLCLHVCKSLKPSPL